MKLATLDLPHDYLAAGSETCVIFCGGFNSNRHGTKALYLEDVCREQEQAYLRFDYRGHGQSIFDFGDCTISTWLSDTLAAIDAVPNGRVILIGSSMGGWLALLAALRRHDKVASLLLLACAADMTKYYPDRLQGLPLKMDERGRQFYEVANEYDDQEPYRIYQAMLDDARQYFVLDKDIDLDIPVTLIHGEQDDVVLPSRSYALMDKLVAAEKKLIVQSSGDHRLSSDGDLAVLRSELQALLIRLAH